MNVLPVSSYVGHAMILHKKLRRMLAMKCRNLGMNHRKLKSNGQPTIQLAILIQMRQEKRKMEQRSSVYWRYTHQNTQHAKASQSIFSKRKTTEKCRLSKTIVCSCLILVWKKVV